MLEIYLLNEINRIRAIAARHGLSRTDEALQDATLLACSEIHDRIGQMDGRADRR